MCKDQRIRNPMTSWCLSSNYTIIHQNERIQCELFNEDCINVYNFCSTTLWVFKQGNTTCSPVFTPIGPLQVSVYWPCSILLWNTQRQIATEKASDYSLLYVTITTCCICSYGQMFVPSKTELDKVQWIPPSLTLRVRGNWISSILTTCINAFKN